MEFVRKNTANAVTLTRLFLTPLLLAFVIAGRRNDFFILMFALAATDVVDGTLAKLLNSETEFGRRLDSIADFVFYPVMSIGSVVLLRVADAIPLPFVLLPFVTPVIGHAASLLFMGKLPMWHLWTWRSATWLLNAFIVVSLVVGMQPWLYWFLIAVGVVAMTEEIAILVRDRGHYDLGIHSFFDKPRRLRNT